MFIKELIRWLGRCYEFGNGQRSRLHGSGRVRRCSSSLLNFYKGSI